jgi:hypothetical protein
MSVYTGGKLFTGVTNPVTPPVSRESGEKKTKCG